jgi:hypothetical protein
MERGFWLSQIAWYKQHRTRPCKKRKEGAPAFVVVTAEIEGWATRRDTKGLK